MDNDLHWYIAIVAPNTEKVAAERLGRDFEVYLPSQKVVSVWKDGRRKFCDKLAIPGRLLVHCTERQRLGSCSDPCVRRYMVDIAGEPNEFGRRPIAIVPDVEVDRLKFVLGQHEAKVLFDNVNLKAGESVRVVRGPLAGLEGTVASLSHATASGAVSDKTRVFITISHLGCASLEVSSLDIERI